MDISRICRRDSICERAYTIPAEQREAFVRQQCAGDTRLHDEVTTLLSCPVVSADGIAIEAPALPSQVGDFELQDQLGSGGMGVVFKAKQEDIDHVVAVKLMHLNALGGVDFEQFRHEGMILARLKHPNIASIYYAGTDPLPFLAMEYVDGHNLTNHAHGKELCTLQRVRLMTKICDGMIQAHGQGIIHRDLKPSNIMVNADGEPKILDFGLATMIDDPSNTATDAEPPLVNGTPIRQIAGTPYYMSPEQHVGDLGEIDIRSDVYALGVILFELLSGTLPYDFSRAQHRTEVANIVREEHAIRLSQFEPALRGDLEAIAAKALCKDKKDRYQTVGDLRLDLQRFLDIRPVEAHHAGSLYRTKKFVRRNPRASVIGICAVLLAALALQKTQQAAIAAATTERVRQISTSVKEYISLATLAANPIQTLGHPVTLREVLDVAAANVDGSFSYDPELQAEIRTVLGRVYLDLREYERAGDTLQQALDVLRDRHGAEHRPTYEAAILLAWSKLHDTGCDDFDRLFDFIAADDAAEHPGTLMVRTVAHMGDGHVLSYEDLQDAVAATMAADWDHRVIATSSLHNFIAFLNANQAHELAADLLEVAAALAPDDLSRNYAKSALMTHLWRTDDFATLDICFEPFLAECEELYGPDHWMLLRWNAQGAYYHIAREEFDAAMEYANEALRIAQDVPGISTIDRAIALAACARLVHRRSDHVAVEQGAELLKQAMLLYGQAIEELETTRTWLNLSTNLADALHSLGLSEESRHLIDLVKRRAPLILAPFERLMESIEETHHIIARGT